MTPREDLLHTQQIIDTSSPPSPSSASILINILTLSWPISLTTMCESLPLLLITSLVGHASPQQLLSSPDATSSSVLEAYALANLIYSTCAFAIVYGIMSGLDSVAASAVGFSSNQSINDINTIIPTTTSIPNAKRSYQAIDQDGDIIATESPHSASATSSPSTSSSHHLLGIWITRCLQLELLIVSLLVTILSLYCDAALRALGEPIESIPIATEYVNILLISVIFTAIFHTLNKGLQSSHIVFPILAIVFIVRFTAVGIVYLALYHWYCDLKSVAWILTITSIVQMMATIIYMYLSGIIQQWWPSNHEQTYQYPYSYSTSSSSSSPPLVDRLYHYFVSTIHGLYTYSLLAFPACLSILAEFWLFDIVGVFAGLLYQHQIELSTHWLMFSVCFMGYLVFSGLSVGVSVVVGEHMGRYGESRLAHRSAVIGSFACMSVSMTFVLLLLIFHDSVGRIFTDDPLVLARFSECMPILIAYTAIDGLNTCSTQLLRTLGVQHYGVFLHFTTYYLVGMGTGYILAFHYGMGVLGLWIGLSCGVGVNALIATIWLWVVADWQFHCESAIARAVLHHHLPMSESTPMIP